MAVVEVAVAVLLILGGLLSAIGSWGVVVLPRFLSRVHGPSVAITGGLGTLLLGSLLWFGVSGDHLTGREVLVIFILAITAPMTAHAMSRAWLVHHPKPALDTEDQCDD